MIVDKGYLAAVPALVLIDGVWLFFSGHYAKRVMEGVQKGPMTVRYFAAAIVYLAMAYIILHASSTLNAFWLGVSTYAVYDFTNYALFSNYDWKFMLMDSLWGGLLFALTYRLLKSYSLVK
jgi:uncharacterized membrane protein